MPPLKRGHGLYAGDILSGDRIMAIRLLTLQGHSGNEIGRILRDQGMTIGRQALQAVVRETIGAVEKSPGIQRTASSFQISEALYQDTTRLRPNERLINLETSFTYFGFDKPRTLTASIRFTGTITKGELLNLAVAQLTNAMKQYGHSISEDELIFTEAYRGVERAFE